MDYFGSNSISGSTNQITTTGSVSDCITYTVTTPGDCAITLTDGNSMWFSFSELDWLPYHFTSYKPEWHILKGYETQMKMMWK